MLECISGLTAFHNLLADSACQISEQFFSIIVDFVLKSFVSMKHDQINYQYFIEI